LCPSSEVVKLHLARPYRPLPPWQAIGARPYLRRSPALPADPPFGDLQSRNPIPGPLPLGRQTTTIRQPKSARHRPRTPLARFRGPAREDAAAHGMAFTGIPGTTAASITEAHPDAAEAGQQPQVLRPRSRQRPNQTPYSCPRAPKSAFSRSKVTQRWPLPPPTPPQIPASHRSTPRTQAQPPRTQARVASTASSEA
jgi:hypothetical protein